MKVYVLVRRGYKDDDIIACFKTEEAAQETKKSIRGSGEVFIIEEVIFTDKASEAIADYNKNNATSYKVQKQSEFYQQALKRGLEK